MPPVFRERQARRMSGIEAAWVAGLLEGEGSFIVNQRQAPRISMQTTDEDVIERLKRVIGAGNVNRLAPRAGRKPCWGYMLNGLYDVVYVLDQIEAFMGARRLNQIVKVRAAAAAKLRSRAQ